MSNQDENIKSSDTSRQSTQSKMGFIFVAIVLVIFAVGFGFVAWQLYKVNTDLAVLKLHSISDQDAISSLQQTDNDLRQATEKSMALSAQQEQIMADWKAAQKGDLNKWHVAEAQYLVKLANDHMQFSHNTSLGLTLLQRANQILQNIQDSSVMELRKSLVDRISQLQQLPQVDVTGLYLELVALNNQLDQVPLPASPLKAEPSPSSTVLADQNQSWWQKGLDQTWQALGKIVIVRNNMKSALPIVMPDEKVFLYQNLHTQLESAMWAALHRNADVYKSSLVRAINWIKIYFDQDAPATQSMLQNLNKLQEVNIQASTINLSATLQLFDHYFSMGETG